MPTPSQTPVLWSIFIVGIVLLAAGFFAVTAIKNAIPEVPEIVIPEVPTAEEVSALVLAGVTIPTAAEIAAEIDVPDTILSVRDEKEVIAEDLATDELDDRDVRDLIVDELNECDDTDVERKDITSIDVKDSDVRTRGDHATVVLELKVYFDNYGDEAESARVDLEFDVEDLDRDDDYEDAEVVDFSVDKSVYSCSTD